MCVYLLSSFCLFATPWTVACEAPLSMGFPRQNYRSGVPFPPPRDLPDPGIEPVTPVLAGGFFIWEAHNIQFSSVTFARSLQSCPTLCDPIDGSPPGSPIPGILQARTLEWAAISFSSSTGHHLLIIYSVVYLLDMQVRANDCEVTQH